MKLTPKHWKGSTDEFKNRVRKNRLKREAAKKTKKAQRRKKK